MTQRETAIISDDFVRATAAPSQEAESWVYTESNEPGYWFPCRRAPDSVGDRDAVRDPDELPKDAILQYPLESRGPQLAGGALPPDSVKDRAVE